MIKFDETDLLMIFDEDTSSKSESEIGFHSYKYTRVDNTAISVGFNKFEHTRPIWILVGIGKNLNIQDRYGFLLVLVTLLAPL